MEVVPMRGPEGEEKIWVPISNLELTENNANRGFNEQYHGVTEPILTNYRNSSMITTTTPQSPAKTPPPSPHRTIFGITRSTFITIFMLILLLIAASVGGGVGGSIAVARAKQQQQPTAPTLAASEFCTPPDDPTKTSSALSNDATETGSPTILTVPPADGLLPLDCPGMSNTQKNVTLKRRTFSFTMSCGTDIPSGINLIAVTAYTIYDCLSACASYNLNQAGLKDTPKTRRCVAVTFNRDYNWSVANHHGTCFLKNDTARAYKDSYHGPNNIVTGRLVGDPAG